MWKSVLLNTLEEHANDWNTFRYAISTLARCDDTILGYTPHVRQVIHRGFVGDAQGDSSDNMIFTTDVRAPKAEEICLQRNAPVELAWFFNPTNQQFRISGSAYVLPAPSHPWRARFPDAQLMPNKDFDWEAERLRVWNALSSRTRSTFFGPPPGTPLAGDDTEKHLSTSDTAPDSFALVVIEPHKVDVLDLKHAERFIYNRTGTRSWNSVQVAP